MSMDLLMVLKGRSLPDVRQLRARLKAQRIPLKLTDVKDLRKHSGLWPMQLDGEEGGFEWCYGDVEGVLGDTPDEIGARDAGADLAFMSERESVCAMYIAAVIADLADGLVLDLETDEFIGPEEALRQARAAHKQLTARPKKTRRPKR